MSESASIMISSDGIVLRDPLLVTKMHVPPPRPGWVTRPRLLDRLNEGLDRKLTLVCAPAGFGKTTLLAEWVQNLAHVPASGSANARTIRSTKRRRAWLSLDRGDNDPVRFWTYLIAALGQLQAGLGAGTLALLHSHQPMQIQSTLTTLINDVAAGLDREGPVRPWVLVLDDYHLITAPPIHDGLAFLVEHLPPGVHLALSTRSEPPLPLARLRARDQLTEFRAADLRFTAEEAAAFLNQMMELELPPEDVALLEARTEGWVAGLHLAAVAIRSRAESPPSASPIPGKLDLIRSLQSLSGSHRHILDYLAEEVLLQQSEPLQAFLLQTSILDRMCGPLCDAVCPDQAGAAGQTGSFGQGMLERLERMNLFTVPLDDQRRWYRYHALFAEVLRERLQQSQPEKLPELHRRAARWYEGEGLADKAVEHALSAGESEHAASLIEGSAQRAVWERGEVATFLRWLEVLPAELVLSRTRLCLSQAWTLLLSGQFQNVAGPLQAAASLLEAPPPTTEGESAPPHDPPSDVRAMRGELAAIQALLVNIQGDTTRAIDLCRSALELVPEDNLLLRSFIAGNLGGAYLTVGDTGAATQSFAEAVRLSRTAGNAAIGLIATAFLGEMYMLRGQLPEAARTYRQALQLTAEPGWSQLPPLGLAHVGLGALLAERNELEQAREHLTEGLDRCQQWAEMRALPPVQFLLAGQVHLARVLQGQGDAVGALAAIETAEEWARRYEHEHWLPQLAAYRARLWLRQGKLTAAGRWAQQMQLVQTPPGPILLPPPLRDFGQTTQARLLIEQAEGEQLRRALALLEPLQRTTEEAGRLGHLIEILALQSLAQQASGQGIAALTTLDRALALAQEGGYVRVFVEEGEPMKGLLRRAVARGISSEYAAELLQAFEQAPPMAQDLAEPLSERELQVLRLIAAGLSNREIAAELVIAVSTAKKHINNIYGKLDVHNRTRAVARARELGLL